MATESPTLDEIMSDAPPVAEQTTETTTTEATPPASGAVRDEHGRFAPKAAGEPEATAQPATTATTEPEGTGMVPQQALHETRKQLQEEREGRIRLEARLDAYERAQRQPATPAEPPKPPPFWDEEAYAEYQRTQLDGALTPIQQAMQTQKLEFSRMMADTKFGEEVVAAADTALGEMSKTNPQEAARIAQKMAQSRHPYSDLVGWHKGVVAQQRIGSDPDAFVQSELDKMLADPAKKAELLARLTGTATDPASPGATSQPSNITRLPPSLSRLPGGNADPSPGRPSLDDILNSGRKSA